MSKIIRLIIDNWLWLGILLSIFWGIYGCNYEKSIIEEKKQKQKGRLIKFWMEDKIEAFGIFLSEFIGSFAGWCCFHVLVNRLQLSTVKLGNFEIFLAIGAVVGMAGYSYNVVGLIKKWGKCKDE